MCRTTAEGGRRCFENHGAGRTLRNLQAKKQYWNKKGENAAADAITNQMTHIRERYAELTASGATVTEHDLPLTENAKQVLSTLRDAGLTPYVVGGSVRDSLFGSVPKDVDIEVYGGSPDEVAQALRTIGKVDEVGKSFGVLKIMIGEEDFDVSLPRRDSKTQEGGHKGFEVEVDQNLSLTEATARRDFTVNALMYDDELGCIIDEHGGLQDMDDRVLRHVSDAFDEDPLRVLRGIQMSSRFQMNLHPDTIEKSKTLSDEFNTLAKERVQIEFQKLFEKGAAHHTAFKTLQQVGWSKNFPGLDEADQKALRRTLQSSSVMIQDGRIPTDKKAYLSLAGIASHVKDDTEARNLLSYLSVGDATKNKAYMLSRVTLPQNQGKAAMRAWVWDMPRDVTARDWVLLNEANGAVTKKKAQEVYAKIEKLGLLDGPEKPFVNGDEVLKLVGVKKPGRWMRGTMDSIRAAQYSRQFKSREDGIAWIEKNKSRLFPAEVL